MKKWIAYKKDYSNLDNLTEQLNISEILARLLINRDIDTVDEAEIFLNPDKTKLYSPYKLSGIYEAILRIELSIKNKEKICIYGDYDVDGITSVAILYNFLKRHTDSITFYIPNRIDEGYGLNNDAIEKLIESNIDLVITVDCGIRSIEEVEKANKAGMDIIITDHHKCGESLPDAYAIINPNQDKCTYPFKHLSGAGVTFKLISALSDRLACQYPVSEYLGLVALATVADVVPLIDENRLIVKKGIKVIKEKTNIGLNALIETCNVNLTEINTYHLGFIIAPRINAAGRLEDAHIVVELLTIKSKERALDIAKKLVKLNVERQSIENKILKSAIDAIQKDTSIDKDRVIVLEAASWHLGVIGIIASRITEKFNKPSIIISVENEIGKGSARSIAGINIFEAISKCEDMLIKFGGHELAAGLTVKKDSINKFRRKINNVVKEMKKEETFYREILVDYKLDKNDNLNDVYNEIIKLEPFGEGNPKPIFVYRGLIVKNIRTVGLNNKHLSLNLFNDKLYLKAIAFNMGYMINYIEINQIIDIICSIEINIWNEIEDLQLHIKDIKLSKNK